MESSPGRVLGQRGRGAGSWGGRGCRTSKVKEPVTLTISSDEEDVGGSPGVAGYANGQLSLGGFTPMTPLAKPSSQLDDDGGFFPTPVKPSTFGVGRKQRMRDEVSYSF